MSELGIGIIGLDTSHVTAFTKLLNDDGPYSVHGGKVVAAFPGGSADFELSRSRVEKFTKELREQYGVQIVHSPRAVAEQVDAILLESVDGRVHLEQFKEVAPFGKPVFIDKRLAVCYSEAEEIARLAAQYNVPWMSSSALRYAEGLTCILKNKENGEIIGVDCFGPMQLEATQPGLFWYGIHCAEVLFTVLGSGCTEVRVTSNNDHDVVTGLWEDGRIGAIRGNRKGNSQFGALVHCEKASCLADFRADEKPLYAGLLEQVMLFFTGRKSPIDAAETLQIIQFIESANRSRDTGNTVHLVN